MERAETNEGGMMYWTIANIKKANKAAGFHFFDQANMEFSDSIVYPEVYGGRYFITAEVPGIPSEDNYLARRYTVRRCEANGRIQTVSEYQQYATIDEAAAAVHGLIMSGASQPILDK